jgi:phage shock protein C
MALFCAGCGASLAGGARFCSACGKPATDPVSAPIGGAAGPLVRPRAGRKIAGVCQGLSNQYGWDPAWVRIITVLLTVFTFPIGLIAYALFWVIVPEEPLLLPSVTNMNTTI